MLQTNIVDLTIENFQEVLLGQDESKVILLDFWADWCEPCKQLAPILDSIAKDYSEQLILAKVDCEKETDIAAQFQIRSIPTLIVFKGGQPVDGLAGAQPESVIREMLAKHLPKLGEAELDEAKQALTEENYEQAYQLAQTAYQNLPENKETHLVLADAATRLGKTTEAKTLLENLTMAEQSSTYYQQIIAAIELAESAANSPEIQALEQALAQNPEDLALKQKLAVQYHLVKRHEEALTLMFEILKVDMNFGDARKQTLDILNGLPTGDALVAKYRGQLYSMLY